MGEPGQVVDKETRGREEGENSANYLMLLPVLDALVLKLPSPDSFEVFVPSRMFQSLKRVSG